MGQSKERGQQALGPPSHIPEASVSLSVETVPGHGAKRQSLGKATILEKLELLGGVTDQGSSRSWLIKYGEDTQHGMRDP